MSIYNYKGVIKELCKVLDLYLFKGSMKLLL